MTNKLFQEIFIAVIAGCILIFLKNKFANTNPAPGTQPGNIPQNCIWTERSGIRYYEPQYPMLSSNPANMLAADFIYCAPQYSPAASPITTRPAIEQPIGFQADCNGMRNSSEAFGTCVPPIGLGVRPVMYAPDSIQEPNCQSSEVI